MLTARAALLEPEGMTEAPGDQLSLGGHGVVGIREDMAQAIPADDAEVPRRRSGHVVMEADHVP